MHIIISVNYFHVCVQAIELEDHWIFKIDDLIRFSSPPPFKNIIHYKLGFIKINHNTRQASSSAISCSWLMNFQHYYPM